MPRTFKDAEEHIWTFRSCKNYLQSNRFEWESFSLSSKHVWTNPTSKHIKILAFLKSTMTRFSSHLGRIHKKIFVSCDSSGQTRKIYERLLTHSHQRIERTCSWERVATSTHVWWWTDSVNLQHPVPSEPWYLLNKEVPDRHPHHFSNSETAAATLKLLFAASCQISGSFNEHSFSVKPLGKHDSKPDWINNQLLSSLDFIREIRASHQRSNPETAVRLQKSVDSWLLLRHALRGTRIPSTLESSARPLTSSHHKYACFSYNWELRGIEGVGWRAADKSYKRDKREDDKSMNLTELGAGKLNAQKVGRQY